MGKNKIFDAFNKVSTENITNFLKSDEFEEKWEKTGERLDYEESIAWATARNTLLR